MRCHMRIYMSQRAAMMLRHDSAPALLLRRAMPRFAYTLIRAEPSR